MEDLVDLHDLMALEYENYIFSFFSVRIGIFVSAGWKTQKEIRVETLNLIL